jgi:phosphoribosylformylglycinamidine synthase subunit PurS
MYKAKIYITLRKSILDPAGKAVENALHSTQFSQVENVRIGKFIELDIKENNIDKAKSIVDEVSHKILSNPIMEDFTFEIEEKV